MKTALSRKVGRYDLELELTLIVSRREDMVFAGFGVVDMTYAL